MALMTTTLKMTGESAGSQKTSRQCNTAMTKAAIDLVLFLNGLPVATVVGLVVLVGLVLVTVRLLSIGLEPGHHPVHGLRAWQEFRAGTRADDPASALQIEALDPEEAGAGLVLRWQSASNRFYAIGLGGFLPDGFTARLATNLPATPPVNVYTAALDGLTNAFFRIELEP